MLTLTPLAPGAQAQVAAGDLVINEIMNNPSAVGDSEGEWFEVYNATGADIDINGYTIFDNDIDTHVIDAGGPLLVPAGGFLVLGNNTDIGTNGGAPVAYSYGGSWFLSNSGDEIVIADTALVEIDRVEYDGGPLFPDPTGNSMALIDPTFDNNVGANWCNSSTTMTGGDLGTPGAANDCPVVEDVGLVINEIMNNPDVLADSEGEYFELFNSTDADIDIEGWTISDNDVDVHVIANGGPLIVPAGDYLVLGNGDVGTPTAIGNHIDYSYGANWFLSNSADEVVVTDLDGVEVDRVEYDGGPLFPDLTGASMALIDPALDNNVGENWCQSGTPFGAGDLGSPGAANDCFEPPTDICDVAVTHAIYEIQGDGDVSPVDGQTVVTEGVVTADFTDLQDGFFIQDAVGDGNPATSDGIFVFRAGVETPVAVGDVVKVQGTASEFFDLTEVSASAISVCGGPATIEPVQPNLPLDEGASFEPFEGMLTTWETLYFSDTFNLHRFGEALMSAGAPLQNPTDVVEPGADAVALADLNARSSIVLDDANGSQFPDPIPYLGADSTTRRGDTIDGLTAVVSYSFGAYKLWPTVEPTVVRQNERPETPGSVGGDIQVASFNVLNYWTTIDDDVNGARGADSEAELERQTTKLVEAILNSEAEILGLQELENNGPTAIGALVDALNAAATEGSWAAVPDPAYPGGLESTNAIKVGIIYRSDLATPIGDSVADDDIEFAVDRPPVAQTFDVNGEVFTVVSNHFKSKSCRDAEEEGDPFFPEESDIGDGQACFNPRRTRQAAALLDFVAALQEMSGDEDVLVLGDFNAYRNEDPIDVLNGGLVNVHDLFGDSDTYSLVFFGAEGQLDYAFSTSGLAEKLTGVDTWHINADEPRVLDYNDFIEDPAESSSELSQLFFPDQYRSSDHDMVLVGLTAPAAADTARSLKEAALDLLLGAEPTQRILRAIDSLESSLDPELWTSDNEIVPGVGGAVFLHEMRAANQLEGEGEVADAAVDLMLAADRILAETKIAIGADAGLGERILDRARAQLALGDALAAADQEMAAMAAYNRAWRLIDRLLGGSTATFL